MPRRLALSALIALVGLATASQPARADTDAQQAGRTQLRQAAADYRWFHKHPELSENEVKTAARLAGELRKLGFQVTEKVGGHGVVAVLQRGPRGRRGGKGSKVLLYRADMDALPIVEATGVPYASQNRGVMHACGHDLHMATALGALRALVADRSWRGTLIFVAQPAEEVGRGARAMLRDPQLKRIFRKVGKPDAAIAVHDSADLPAGTVALSPGFMWANVDTVSIELHGKGGHGARPHQAIDPIVIGSELVLALQTIVSRRLPPGTRAVITVGSFRAGTKSNIIPPSARLELTVRSYEGEVRKRLLREIRSTAVAVARAHNAPKPPTVTIKDEFTPAGRNHPGLTRRLEARFTRELGAKNVVEQSPTLGGEDFARFGVALKIPSVMWRLGAASRRQYRRNKDALPGLHSDRYAPEYQPALRAGITSVVAAALEIFGS